LPDDALCVDDLPDNDGPDAPDEDLFKVDLPADALCVETLFVDALLAGTFSVDAFSVDGLLAGTLFPASAVAEGLFNGGLFAATLVAAGFSGGLAGGALFLARAKIGSCNLHVTMLAAYLGGQAHPVKGKFPIPRDAAKYAWENQGSYRGIPHET
jgi:hypothetical protein